MQPMRATIEIELVIHGKHDPEAIADELTKRAIGIVVPRDDSPLAEALAESLSSVRVEVE